MTTNDESPRPEAAFFTTIRSWGMARGEHGVFGGVLEGVGDRIGLDRVPARIIGVVLLFATGGIFLAAYAAAWALLPDRSGRIILQDFGRGTPNVGALIVIAVFAIIGMNSVPGAWSSNGNWGPFPFGILWALIPLGLLAGVIALVVILATRDKGQPHRHGAAAKPAEAGAFAAPSQRNAPAAATPTSASTARPAKAAASGDAAAAVVDTVPALGADGAASSHSHATAPTVTPPPVAPRPRTPGPGSAIYLLALSAAVFASAAIWLLEREGRLAVAPVVAWFAVAVVILGGAIILTGAVGRRVGFLGFLATTFVIGWIIGLAVVPHAFGLTDGAVTVTINGVRHTVGDGHGWFDESANGIACGSYRASATDLSGATRYLVEPGQATVTLSSAEAVLVVPHEASLVFRSDGIMNGSLSIEGRDATCQFDRAQGTLFSTYGTGDTVTVTITEPDAVIAIEES